MTKERACEFRPLPASQAAAVRQARASDDQREPPARDKPLLTVSEQIAHMKAKGITFDLCSEAEAAEHLRTKCQFFRVYAYRKLFDRRVGGARDGQYVGLDFGHLRALSRVDRKLRDTLLPMTLDVEHFAKVRLLGLAEEHGEDGHDIVRRYRESLPADQLAYLDRDLERRQHDTYSGNVVSKYRDDMPLWVLLDVVSFGTFLGVIRFCAKRWGSRDLNDLWHLLLRIKAVRNFCAHSKCSLNDLTVSGPSRERTPVSLARAMNTLGIPVRLREKRLASPRMKQISTLLFVYARDVPAGLSRDERAQSLRELFSYAAQELAGLPPQNQALAALSFLERLTRSFGLIN